MSMVRRGVVLLLSVAIALGAAIIGVVGVVCCLSLGPHVIVELFRRSNLYSSLVPLLVHAGQAFAIVAGFVTYIYCVFRIADSPLGERIKKIMPSGRILVGLDIILLMLLTPFLIYDIQRIGYTVSLTYNEGWNVFHVSRILHGEVLYQPLTRFPFTPVNYPPLSFLLVGAMSFFTGNVLFAGRLLALVALLFVALLIYWILEGLNPNRPASALGALLWLILMTREANFYVGSYDPQLIGHVFSLGALYLYVRRRDKLTVPEITAIALLCSLALFIKFLLISVPMTIAVTLLLSDKKRLGPFALVGVVMLMSMGLASWLLFGRDFFTNIFVVEHDRGWQIWRWLALVKFVLVDRFGIVLLAPAAMLLPKIQRRWAFALIYLVVSLVTGVYFSGASGVIVNAWFDFFIAASLIVGILAGEFEQSVTGQVRVAVCGILVACLLPGLADLKPQVERTLDYSGLQQGEQTYRSELRRLHSIPGLALFESPLLGFAAGKEFLFDPFIGTELILSKRFPESFLTERIRNGYFSAIVLGPDTGGKLSAFDKSRARPPGPRSTVNERWTDGTLIAILENYQLLDQENPGGSFFYVPRKR
jgi:hypothetical protein